ncbi:uncharacterized protein MKK02DRAFT_32478 [Dioszegia hungarica]|uniref:Uncharacterized protein n=1 Tax=Dioszegia hungarica TaxID=4972 RepID=A0AA38LUY6_9TREE|nr:uncharacterized protein MKK02DRAFT_32478 [Dioszegia hungarica]KAI9637692.1 hypothetical protein MKK02DRAFT_32478 [Dioszegia hungarica]
MSHSAPRHALRRARVASAPHLDCLPLASSSIIPGTTSSNSPPTLKPRSCTYQPKLYTKHSTMMSRIVRRVYTTGTVSAASAAGATVKTARPRPIIIRTQVAPAPASAPAPAPIGTKYSEGQMNEALVYAGIIGAGGVLLAQTFWGIHKDSKKADEEKRDWDLESKLATRDRRIAEVEDRMSVIEAVSSARSSSPAPLASPPFPLPDVDSLLRARLYPFLHYSHVMNDLSLCSYGLSVTVQLLHYASKPFSCRGVVNTAVHILQPDLHSLDVQDSLFHLVPSLPRSPRFQVSNPARSLKKPVECYFRDPERTAA